MLGWEALQVIPTPEHLIRVLLCAPHWRGRLPVLLPHLPVLALPFGYSPALARARPTSQQEKGW